MVPSSFLVIYKYFLFLFGLILGRILRVANVFVAAAPTVGYEDSLINAALRVIVKVLLFSIGFGTRSLSNSLMTENHGSCVFPPSVYLILLIWDSNLFLVLHTRYRPAFHCRPGIIPPSFFLKTMTLHPMF